MDVAGGGGRRDALRGLRVRHGFAAYLLPGADPGTHRGRVACGRRSVARPLAGRVGGCGLLLAFVGYQSEGSLGRRLQNGLQEVPVEDNGRTKALKVKLHVETVDGFSGHADRRQLLGYCKKISPKPKRVVVVHGEASKANNLSSTLYDMFGFEASAPRNLDSIRLI